MKACRETIFKFVHNHFCRFDQVDFDFGGKKSSFCMMKYSYPPSSVGGKKKLLDKFISLCHLTTFTMWWHTMSKTLKVHRTLWMRIY